MNDNEIVNKFWNSPLAKKDYPDVDKNREQHSQNLFPTNNSLQMVPYYEFIEMRQLSIKRLWMAAATFLDILTASFAFHFNNSFALNENLSRVSYSNNEETSRNGPKTSIILSEGTKIWLNAGSQILYNKESKSKFKTK